MALSTGLIVKGLLGAGATSGVITCIVKKDEIRDWLTGIEGKKKSLGLPTKCEWPTEVGTSKDCDNLTGDNLKVINFAGKVENQDLTVEPSSVTPTPSATLTIEKVSDSDFPQGYKFIFKTTTENGITLKKDSADFVALKKDIGIDFKIKKDGGKWSLEKAWDAKKLLSKLGITNCESTENKCTLPKDQTINVIDSNNKKITDLKVSAEGKISFSDNKVKRNQGYEFTIDSTAISLSGGTPESGATPPTSLETSKKYQIKKETDGKWYLAEVSGS